MSFLLTKIDLTFYLTSQVFSANASLSVKIDECCWYGNSKGVCSNNRITYCSDAKALSSPAGKIVMDFFCKYLSGSVV